MNKPKISIVVAMYNIQDYIIPCLESCAKQQDIELDDYEVIIVNDGSTDNSPQLVETYIEDKQNFRMVTQKNGGLSAARNTGIDDAKGEYVWFVDGDDAIAPNAINILACNIEESHCDAYIHNFSTFEKDGEYLETSDFLSSETIINGREFHEKKKSLLPQMAWLTVYRLSLVRKHDLQFLEGILHEDMEFSTRAHHLSSSIKILHDSLYYYRVSRVGSIMNMTKKNNTKSLLSYYKIFKSHEQFFKNENTAFSRKILSLSAIAFFQGRYSSSFCKNEITDKLLKNKTALYKALWKSKEIKHRSFLFLIIILPSCLICLINKYLTNRSKLM